MKIFLRAIIFLLLLFVVLYVGMNNTHSVDFFFPVLSEKKIRATAAILYFSIFAIGVLAGITLNAGGGSKRESGGKR